MYRIALFFIVLGVSFGNLFSQGCSQCKLMAEQSTGIDEGAFASNINWGILYLMAFPYLILMFLFRKPLLRFIKSFWVQPKSPQ